VGNEVVDGAKNHHHTSSCAVGRTRTMKGIWRPPQVEKTDGILVVGCSQS